MGCHKYDAEEVASTGRVCPDRSGRASSRGSSRSRTGSAGSAGGRGRRGAPRQEAGGNLSKILGSVSNPSLAFQEVQSPVSPAPPL